jgi:hypothetical protein
MTDETLTEATVPKLTMPDATNSPRQRLAGRTLTDEERLARLSHRHRRRAANANRQREWWNANRERCRERTRAWYHGLSVEGYRALLARNACDICGTSQGRLCIDHCHRTGRVRGLLCDNCNKGVGFFADDPGVIQAARGYLQNPPTPHGAA